MITSELKELLSSFHPSMKDDNGRLRTQSLFWEYRNKGREEELPAFFCLKEKDHEAYGLTFLSLKSIYMSYDHIPGYEYDFAIDVFGAWNHWERLSKESLIRPYIKAWRDELEVKLRSKAVKAIIRNALEDREKGVSSAKYLADKGWVPSRGRPSKEEVEREKKIAAGVTDEVDEDMKRLGLSVVQGGRK